MPRQVALAMIELLLATTVFAQDTTSSPQRSSYPRHVNIRAESSVYFPGETVALLWSRPDPGYAASRLYVRDARLRTLLSRALTPEEAVAGRLTWDQKDGTGQPVTPGAYHADLHFNNSSSNHGYVQGGSAFSITRRTPDGVVVLASDIEHFHPHRTTGVLFTLTLASRGSSIVQLTGTPSLYRRLPIVRSRSAATHALVPVSMKSVMRSARPLTELQRGLDVRLLEGEADSKLVHGGAIVLRYAVRVEQGRAALGAGSYTVAVPVLVNGSPRTLYRNFTVRGRPLWRAGVRGPARTPGRR